MSTDIGQYTGLLDVQTGEVLPATISNAARVISAARAMKQHVNAIVREATDYLAQEATRQGTKTLHDGDETVTLTGGITTEYDAQELMDLLQAAGCPEDRIGAAVTTEISYRIDRAVLRQLAAANPDYKAAIDLASHQVERDYRATVKLRRHSSE